MSAERYNPSEHKAVMAQAHWSRYVFTLDKAESRHVIDVGCGCGYGTYLLSIVADSVIGVDRSEKAIDYAKEHYNADNVSFIVSDWLDYECEGYDVAISFEFLEHLSAPEEAARKMVYHTSEHIVASMPINQGDNEYHIAGNMDYGEVIDSFTSWFGSFGTFYWQVKTSWQILPVAELYTPDTGIIIYDTPIV